MYFTAEVTLYFNIKVDRSDLQIANYEISC